MRRQGAGGGQRSVPLGASAGQGRGLPWPLGLWRERRSCAASSWPARPGLRAPSLASPECRGEEAAARPASPRGGPGLGLGLAGGAVELAHPAVVQPESLVARGSCAPRHPRRCPARSRGCLLAGGERPGTPPGNGSGSAEPEERWPRPPGVSRPGSAGRAAELPRLAESAGGRGASWPAPCLAARGRGAPESGRRFATVKPIDRGRGSETGSIAPLARGRSGHRGLH